MSFQVCGKRVVGDLTIFESDDAAAWEALYAAVVERKYAKNTRNFGRAAQGAAVRRPASSVAEPARAAAGW